MTDPRHPVIVGAHELAVRTADAEPIEMMVTAARHALMDAGNFPTDAVSSVRIVKGIWPYSDPGTLVAERLGCDDVTTALTRIGGNATYDLVNQTASEIADGSLDAVIICGAESMRTRRRDKSQGRRSTYLEEASGAEPTFIVGDETELTDAADDAAGVNYPVNFYAMADSVLRHRRGETPRSHLERISLLWARGSSVAAQNPHAWIQAEVSPGEIATPSPKNRMVAAPYTKLLTSNINVDQGASLVLCSYEVAQTYGIPDEAMVFLVSGSGAHDHLALRERAELDQSPAFRLSAHEALNAAQLVIDDITHLDLYSCFPASVQLAQNELAVDPARPFTLTGGLTFAGGPFNGYCTQALAHAVTMLRGTTETALLYGNGGFFSKHSVIVASGHAPATPFSYSRPQAAVDALPRRDLGAAPTRGTIEAYTVTYQRNGDPVAAILSILAEDRSRHWARSVEPSVIAQLLAVDVVGTSVDLHAGSDNTPPLVTSLS